MLDIKMKREGKKIKTEVYRKATHTDHYLQWTSHHPVEQKLSVPASLFHRCEAVVTDDTSKEIERDKIRQDLTACGYPPWALTQAKKKGKERDERKDEKRGKK